MRVLSARGELEQAFGGGILRQLFGAPVAAMACPDRERVMSGAAGLTAAALSIPDAETDR